MTMRMRFILMAVTALIMRVTAFQGKIGCDDVLTVYLDGVEVASNTVCFPVTDISLADTPTVIAAKCVNMGGGGGIVGSFDDGVVTDTSWLCSGTESAGWAEPSFNDSAWASAVLTDNAPGLDNYEGVSASAKFIWNDTQSTGTTFCRKNLVPDTNEECAYNGTAHPLGVEWWVEEVASDGLVRRQCRCPHPLPETWNTETDTCTVFCVLNGYPVLAESIYFRVIDGTAKYCSCSVTGLERCSDTMSDLQR